MEERKFVCKFCNKRYPCGKSLGGHIRTHMTEHSPQHFDRKISNADGSVKLDSMRKKKRDLMGLRDNPRKTSRFGHSNTTLHPTRIHDQDKLCKECGKGFPSLKALCGHMASHSEKEKQKLVMDTQSDTETSSAPTHPRASKRMRFMILNNGSSSVSDVEQEQEEVARCLMLLSQESSLKGRFGLVSESSDNKSVVLEAKSPSVDTRITINNGKNSVCNASEVMEKKKVRNSDISDSGYFRYDPQKLKSDGFKRFGFEDYDYESMKNRSRSRKTESKVMETLDYAKTDEATRKFDMRNRENLDGVFRKDQEIYKNGGKGWIDGCSYESDEDSQNSTDTDSYHAQKPQSRKTKKTLKSKRSSKEHECPICNRIFRSGQALGGHKRSHFVRGFEENTTLVIKQDSAAEFAPCLIDLNLPAPVDE